MKKKVKQIKKNIWEKINDIDNEDTSFSTFEVIIIILFSVVFGVVSGYLLTYSNSSLSRIRSDKDLKELVETYDNILNNYYKEVDGKDLADAGIKGMVNALNDPYSYYLDQYTTSDFDKSVSGEYVGIGITVQFEEGYNKVIDVVPDGPAYKVGILEGDIILSVDGNDCYNLYPEKLNELIGGKVDTPVVVSVLRNKISIDYKIIREKIELWSVESDLLENNIGYIKINLFSANSYKQFGELLNKLEDNGINSLIIDVRDNPGGHVSQTNKILKMFFKKKTVLYQTESNGKKSKVLDDTKEERNYPVVLLVNGVTASSSEILVSCFKDNYKDATTIGTKTYGKGSVQKSISLGNGSSIKYTVQKWYTAKGKFINNLGIDPDIVIEKDSNDSQLLKAISLLKNR